jgi:hypothetical protein
MRRTISIFRVMLSSAPENVSADCVVQRYLGEMWVKMSGMTCQTTFNIS